MVAAVDATEPRGGLRDGLLSGAHTRRDWLTEAGDAPSVLLGFLREDRDALGTWFGALPRVHDRASRRVQLRGAVDRDIVRIDAMISAQLDAILHHPRLQRLEGSWRALGRLVAQADGEAPVAVRILSAQWPELARDLERAIEFDHSALFRLVYENEFGHAGGEPFGLLLVDHEVSHRIPPRTAHGRAPVDDIMVVKLLRAVAASAFVPTILAASPALLGADRFGDLALSHDITAILGDHDHARWRSLTEAEDSRFLGLTLPRMLARPVWRRAQTGGWYEEYAPDEAARCWCVAGYALAGNVLRAHAAHRWPADIRGVVVGRVGGGLVTDLVSDDFTFGAATTLPRAVTDLTFTDSQERALVAANLIALNMLPYGQAAFGAVRSLQSRELSEPGRASSPAQANRRVSAEINAMLCASRFAHYLKIIGRDMTGSHATASEIQRVLQDWLRRYTNANVSPEASSRARYPLLSSQVQVTENPGRPGSFGCVIQLQPFYQLDDVSTVLRLTTHLSSAEGAASFRPITLEEHA